VTRIFSILEVTGGMRTRLSPTMKSSAERPALHQERRRRHPAIGLGQAGGGIFFIVDALDTKAKGYDVVGQLPKEGIGSAAEAIARSRGPRTRRRGRS